MGKKTDSLLFRFGIVFLIFTLVTIIMSGIMTYFGQMNIYKKQCERDIRQLAHYLREMILDDSENFLIYKNYYMEHYDEVDIPYDFDDFISSRQKFEAEFSEVYPGKAYGKEVRFEDMSPELQETWFIYMHEYWLLTFEKARKSFQLPYTYFLVPRPEIYHMVYMIDGERTRRKDDPDLLYLGDEYYDDPEEYAVQWEAWFSDGEKEGYQVWDNEWGHTYAFYTPLEIGGEKIGLIGTEVEVADVNREILINTLNQGAGIAALLVVVMLVMLWVINKRHITRISRLADGIQTFAKEKDVNLAGFIRRDIRGKDEISALEKQVADMIMELDAYMGTLVRTADELSATKREAAAMSEISQKDPVTGIRNKTAYESEVKRLEWEMEQHPVRFGIGLADLNGLKWINETFGEDQGNHSIRKVCRMVCSSFHHSPVFHLGGGRFVILIENEDLEEADKRAAEFEAGIDAVSRDENLLQWERISAALGYAIFDPNLDENVQNVYDKANEAMLLRKDRMRAEEEEE